MKRACRCCGRLFIPRPNVPDQRYCSRRKCQNARRRQVCHTGLLAFNHPSLWVVTKTCPLVLIYRHVREGLRKIEHPLLPTYPYPDSSQDELQT